MIVLGISAYYHDSSAAIIVDGEVIAGAQEERFSRLKHDNGFPCQAIRFCLEYSKVSFQDIDAIVFYEKPFLKFERILRSHIAGAPKGLPMFVRTLPIWLKEKLNMRKTIKNELKKIFGVEPICKIHFVEHHLAHAALAYKASGETKADILVVDAVGEWATTSVSHAEGNMLMVKYEQRFPDSLGMLYSAFTQFLGFKVNSDEYKVMGLAPYGNSDSDRVRSYLDLIRTELISGWAGKLPKLNLSYFKFHYSDSMINHSKWEKLFGMRTRKAKDAIIQEHKELALAAQLFLEEVLLSLLEELSLSTEKEEALCIGGGVALNCSANGKILKSSKYRKVYVPFAPGDCGCAIGAALAYLMLNERETNPNISPYLGPDYAESEVEKVLKVLDLAFTKFNDESLLLFKTSELIAEGNIIGWFQGRMEMGPRALGNRSILADARNPKMKDLVNSKIKFREEFRPFAPSVLEEDSKEWFGNNQSSPYMMFTFDVLKPGIPAVTHVDNSARIQTVNETENPLYYRLLRAFKEKAGCSLVLNTSFNVMGEPIVCSPEDAIRTFLNSGLDYLIISNFIVNKS